MKHYLLFLSMICLSLVACTDDQANNQDTDTDSTTTNTTTTTTADVAVKDRPGSGPNGSFLPPLDPGEGVMVNTLTTDFWIFEFYVIEDKATRAMNKGRWFKFSPDGTYESGKWEDQTAYGVWRIQEEPEGLMLYLDSIDDSEDAKWEIQGVNEERDTMTWAGISETNTAGAITKVINLLSRPTKKQFGVE
jgi:hypothetical protein